MVSFLPTRMDACSSALTTLMYESCIDVYLPTSTMLTVSNCRSCLSDEGKRCQRSQSWGRSVGSLDLPRRELLPSSEQALSSLPSLVSDVDGVELEPGLEVGDEALVLKEEGDVVGRLDVVNAHHLRRLDVAEHRHLVHRRSLKLLLASAGNLHKQERRSVTPDSDARVTQVVGGTYEIREETEASEVSDGRLSGLRLLLATDDGDQGDVEDGKVLVSDSELELSHRLDERGRLNVSNGSTKLQS